MASAWRSWRSTLIGYFKNEIDTIRGMVSPGSQVDFVLVSSTHQHEGPDTMGLWGADELSSGIDFGYLDFVNATVADCIDDAAAHLEPARVYYATGNSAGSRSGRIPRTMASAFGDAKVLAGDERSRRPPRAGSSIRTSPSCSSPKREWHYLDVLATLVNFGSHPESMGSNNTLITSDFPNYVRQRIEAEYGGLAIWMAGDLGVLQGPLDIDVLDPVTHAPAPRRTFRFAEVHGTQLAERAIAAIDAVRLKKGKPNPSNGDPSPKIDHATVDPVAVPLDNPVLPLLHRDRRDRRAALALHQRGARPVGRLPASAALRLRFRRRCGEDLHTEVSRRADRQGRDRGGADELDPQIGFGYREQLADATGAEHTFIAGLGNDEIGYQVPFAKWDDSCHACAPYVIAGVPQFCPIQPTSTATRCSRTTWASRSIRA